MTKKAGKSKPSEKLNLPRPGLQRHQGSHARLPGRTGQPPQAFPIRQQNQENARCRQISQSGTT